MPRREGSRLFLDGEVSVRTAAALAAHCAPLVRQGVDTVDFGAVTAVDSAAVALALALLREAGAGALRFARLPEAMRELAALYGVAEFLPAERA